MLDQTAYLIISCDAYSGLWKTHFECLEKHWSDCPLPKYLLSNNKDSGHSEIKTIAIGYDLTWSANLKKALEVLRKDYKYVLATFDDLFLDEKVDNHLLAHTMESFRAQGGDFVQLIKWHNKPKNVDQYLGKLETGSLYRPNCVYALWDIEVLDYLLDPEENAWQFERNGAKRSDIYDGFYAVNRSIFNYRNVVVRGKIVRKDARDFSLEGLENLKVMNLREQLAFILRLWSFKAFLFITPRRLQSSAVKLKNKIIKK